MVTSKGILTELEEKNARNYHLSLLQHPDEIQRLYWKSKQRQNTFQAHLHTWNVSRWWHIRWKRRSRLDGQKMIRKIQGCC